MREFAARLTFLLVVLSVLACAWNLNAALAHTKLTGSFPSAGDVLEEPPAQIHLTFSGKLEASASLHTIRLSDEVGEALSVHAAELVDDSRALMATLPPLDSGNYTVAYRVISSDGHPIEGSFSFQIAAQETGPPEEEPSLEAPSTEAPPAAGSPPQEEAPLPSDTGHTEHGEHEPQAAGGGTVPVFAGLLFAGRIIYYASMLPLVGWALWSCLHRMNEDRMSYWRSVGRRLQLVHLPAFLAFALLHWLELAGGNPGASFVEVLRSTGIGQYWLFTAILSLAGFPLLFHYRFVDGAWAVGFIVVKTLSGHSGAFEPAALSRFADAVHMAGAALWVGGLLAFLLLARRSEEWFRAFAPAFSGAAFISFAVLAATGAALAFIYAEQLSDLFETLWGTLLIGKAALAVAVLPVAAGLRRKLRAAEQKPEAFRQWLRLDLALMAGIISITGVLTHVSPVPERMPFHWHVMGQTAHMTAEINSVKSGVNDVTVIVWVPEGEAVPSVSISAKRGETVESDAELVPMEVPAEGWEYFPGFEKHTFAGKLQITNVEETELQVQVRRQTGELHEYAKALIE